MIGTIEISTRIEKIRNPYFFLHKNDILTSFYKKNLPIHFAGNQNLFKT